MCLHSNTIITTAAPAITTTTTKMSNNNIEKMKPKNVDQFYLTWNWMAWIWLLNTRIIIIMTIMITFCERKYRYKLLLNLLFFRFNKSYLDTAPNERTLVCVEERRIVAFSDLLKYLIHSFIYQFFKSFFFPVVAIQCLFFSGLFCHFSRWFSLAFVIAVYVRLLFLAFLNIGTNLIYALFGIYKIKYNVILIFWSFSFCFFLSHISRKSKLIIN